MSIEEKEETAQREELWQPETEEPEIEAFSAVVVVVVFVSDSTREKGHSHGDKSQRIIIYRHIISAATQRGIGSSERALTSVYTKPAIMKQTIKHKPRNHK